MGENQLSPKILNDTLLAMPSIVVCRMSDTVLNTCSTCTCLF